MDARRRPRRCWTRITIARATCIKVRAVMVQNTAFDSDSKVAAPNPPTANRLAMNRHVSGVIVGRAVGLLNGTSSRAAGTGVSGAGDTGTDGGGAKLTASTRSVQLPSMAP